MKKKVLFFDIDGTLWDEDGNIPESTVKAIKKLQENGHMCFLCTGRARSNVQSPKLLSLGFDGIVSGCGTMIEYGGETIFYYQMSREDAIRMVESVLDQGFDLVLEGRENLYLDEERFAEDVFIEKLKKNYGDIILPLTSNWGKWEISKCTVKGREGETKKAFEPSDDSFDYMIHDPYLIEMVPKGFHKGTGILKVCELLDVSLEDTLAFGDSANDMEMIHTAGIGVAMGNGTEAIKEAADYVTTPLDQDGIWNACLHFGLI